MKRNFMLLLIGIFLNPALFAQIHDIKIFLNQCPNNDPIIDTLLNDFEIRLNGELVTEFPCIEPISNMDTTDYTNPLIYLQTLRVIYYMDKDTSVHLPWTDTTFYVWLKNAVDGINIVDGVSGGYCCSTIDGKKFFVTGNPNGIQREFDKKWIGISGNVSFFAHEARHTDIEAPGHTSCCGINNGCDQEYDESNLGAYGVQFWLFKSLLTGYINVGARTSHSQTEIDEIINWHLSGLNDQFRNRFCENIPDFINIEDIDNPLGSSYADIDLYLNGKLNLYPNPIKSGSELIIEVPNIERVEIYNLNGILIKSIDSSNWNSNLKISTSNITQGYYLVKIQDYKGKIFMRKLIVQ